MAAVYIKSYNLFAFPFLETSLLAIGSEKSCTNQGSNIFFFSILGNFSASEGVKKVALILITRCRRYGPQMGVINIANNGCHLWG